MSINNELLEALVKFVDREDRVMAYFRKEFKKSHSEDQADDIIKKREAFVAPFRKIITRAIYANNPYLKDRASNWSKRYNLVLKQKDGEWYGHAEEYPEAMGDGRTPAQCIRNTRKALRAAVLTILESGHEPPKVKRLDV